MPPTNKSQVKRARATKYYKKKLNADEALPVGDSLNDATQGSVYKYSARFGSCCFQPNFV